MCVCVFLFVGGIYRGVSGWLGGREVYRHIMKINEQLFIKLAKL